MPAFSHLHLHSQYSLMEGAIRLKPLAKALKSKEFKACAITDHGNLFGAVEFEQALKKEGIKPIVGLGAYVILKGSRHERPTDQREGRAYQTQLLCQNREGYQNLIRLSSRAYLEGKHRGIPRVDQELLEHYQSGLIALSGGIEGGLAHLILSGQKESAYQLAQWYADVFSGRYYIELQSTGRPEQETLNPQLIELAQTLQLPLVGTNDCHYLTEEEADAHYVLELMRLQRRVTDSNIPPMKPAQLFLRTTEQMVEAFSNLPQEALSNTQLIVDQCELSLENKTYYLPKVKVPEAHTLDSWLIHEAKEGLNRRLQHLYALYHPEASLESFRKVYDERLDFELNVIIGMKFPGYFLIVADFINWAKDHGISVGPGRGSGAGSLVAYALRITDVDPLRYGLLFERFLNPDRISLPDFDVDFEVSGREHVIQYVKEHYGSSNVCQIATFQSLGAKAVIRSVARVLDIPYSEADKLAKLIPNKLGISLEEAIQQEQELAAIEKTGTEIQQKLISRARILEGLSIHLGTHAAGVIIMDTDIQEVMPVCTGKDGSIQSMFTMKYAEDQGAVKFDFLGLLNLSIIDEALKLINMRKPPEAQLTVDVLDMEDPLTFQLFCRGDTTGVFQLESSGMKKLLVDMRPSVFEDIVAILALYRPGPLGSGMVDDFIRCKHGKKAVVYPHPLLKDILKETYGVIVYQEQIMQAVQVLAGFTLGQADLLRRAIGKKTPEILAQQRQIFVEGCVANPEFIQGCRLAPDQTANDIFDIIDYFSGYGFNKSHTVAYGIISYQTAYLKAHYPVEFMAALLNCSMSNPDKVVNFIGECRQMKIPVLPPDLNESVKAFTVSVLNTTPAVRFGLNAVKNVGGIAVDSILDARASKPSHRFQNVMDFTKSVDLTKVNKRVLETLVKCGAFDAINPNRASLFEGLDEAMHLGQEFQRDQNSQQNSLFDFLDQRDAQSTETQLVLPYRKDWNKKQRLELEKETLGFFVSGHPLEQYWSEIKQVALPIQQLKEGKKTEGNAVTLAGMIVSKMIKLNKKSERFAIIKVEDLSDTIEFALYAKVYAESQELLEKNEPIFIKGRVYMREEEVSFTPDSVQLCSQYRQELAKMLVIRVQQPLPPDQVRRLKGAFSKSPGNCQIRVHISTPENTSVLIQLQEKICPDLNLINEIEEILKHQTLEFRY